ncbi:NlpC/P60 family protein [Micromonospora sp. NPDC049559]|uniref:C40 family peptidase n=1 Tax=Micromonospora sp. NPDC049559 TaxID=3155923 RepID=UPI0034312F33
MTPAVAEPSVTEIEKQIDTAWNKLEPVIEQYNATHEDLVAKQKQADGLAKQLQPLQLQVDLAMGKVGQFAARTYMGNTTSAVNAILSSGSPTQLTDQLELLAHFAKEQRNDVQAAMDLRDQLAAKKAPLDALIAQLAKTDAELAVKKKQINAEVDRLQALRVKVGGNGDGNFRLGLCPTEYTGGKQLTVAKFACAQIGKRYVWGADGPDTYDCSGLMLAAWAKVGVSLPHNAARQYNTMRHVSRSQLQPGDLVFYNGLAHVGMYVGGGFVVHAPHTGDHVRMKKIDDGSIVGYGRPD